jgi:hypothetical protein
MLCHCRTSRLEGEHKCHAVAWFVGSLASSWHPSASAPLVRVQKGRQALRVMIRSPAAGLAPAAGVKRSSQRVAAATARAASRAGVMQEPHRSRALAAARAEEPAPPRVRDPTQERALKQAVADSRQRSAVVTTARAARAGFATPTTIVRTAFRTTNAARGVCAAPGNARLPAAPCKRARLRAAV